MEAANQAIDHALREVKDVSSVYNQFNFRSLDHDQRVSRDSSLHAVSTLMSAKKGIQKEAPTMNKWESLVHSFRGADIARSYLYYGLESYLDCVSEHRPSTVEDARIALTIVENNLKALQKCIAVLSRAKENEKSTYTSIKSTHNFGIDLSLDGHVGFFDLLRRNIEAKRSQSREQIAKLMQDGKHRGVFVNVKDKRDRDFTVGKFVYEFHATSPDGRIIIRDLGAKHGEQIPEIVGMHIADTMGFRHFINDGKLQFDMQYFRFNELICDVH